MKNLRNKKIPTNCAICDEPVKPDKNKYYKQTCCPAHYHKLISRNSSRAVKNGRIPRAIKIWIKKEV